ncbi:MAG TPA: metallophosphoesterase [Candidatus Binataceae bacterium]|nr:metallophosphoesterase [Candidatus Binataceae bacterium]
MNEYQSVPHQMRKGKIGSFARPDNAYRSLWISDFHLGTHGCKAGALHSFLRSVESKNLYLVGDIVDGWNLGTAWYWSEAQNDVVTEIAAWQRRGTRVVFVPGNHDQIGLIESLLGISAHCGELIHVTANGCRMLVTHGHQFDSSLSSARWLALMGSKAYGAALRINDWYFRERFGRQRNTRSLSGYWKAPVWSAVRYLTAVDLDEHALFEVARKHKADGVICGHTHRAEQRLIGPIWYINDGDWVQNCTALAESFDGTLSLIRWDHSSGTVARAVSLEMRRPYEEHAAI